MSFGFRGRHGRRAQGVRNPTGRAGGSGQPGQCICPRCGMITEKIAGQPCFLTPCPRCQTMMAGRFPVEDQPDQKS